MLLHSPSGAGKTSLVQAGLSVDLADSRFNVLPVALVGNRPPPRASLPATANRYTLSLMLSLEQVLPEAEQRPAEALAFDASVARALDLDEDLAEAIALAHDLGHTPFGHGGEAALDAAMAPYGGFDHNEQTFRILTDLERPYADFDGLNLTWETLEGTVKHNGPLTNGSGTGPSLVPQSVAAFSERWDLKLSSHAGPEAQVAALADDIAYNNHDVDDGLRAGLFQVADLDDVPLVGAIFAEVRRAHPGIEEARLVKEAVRRLIDRMVNDLLAETRDRLAQAGVRSSGEVRALGAPVVAFSEEMGKNGRALKDFLFERMYRHDKVNRKTAQVQQVVRALFAHYLANPAALPAGWQDVEADERTTARLVADYIAGMTDRFALEEVRKLPLKG